MCSPWGRCVYCLGLRLLHCGGRSPPDSSPSNALAFLPSFAASIRSDLASSLHEILRPPVVSGLHLSTVWRLYPPFRDMSCVLEAVRHVALVVTSGC